MTVDERAAVTGSETPPGSDDGGEGLPVPESLLAPLLDVAATTLARYEGDLPAVLRPLAGFDARGLRSGPARQQLHRALGVDPVFRARVAERFVERPEVQAAVEAWDAPSALRKIDDTAERSDLPVLASMLFAVRPPGWAFGLGLACAAFDRQRREKERDDDAKARDTQLITLDEAKRRAENARDAAQREVDRLETQLRDERRARREKELKADRAVDDAARRRQEAEATAAQAQDAIAAAETRAAREAERARDAETRLRAMRREHAAAAEERSAVGGFSDEEVHALADAARDAKRLAGRLEALTTARPSPAPAAAGSEAASKRTRAPCPPGMRSDSPDALDAMLRTRGVQLVVDGYNVSMAGWRDDAPALQRERLVSRTRTAPPSAPRRRRRGVRRRRRRGRPRHPGARACASSSPRVTRRPTRS